MRKAIALAKKGEGETNPNPVVGAVVVKNGKIVGEGYHKKAGLPHAEVEAIIGSGASAIGATLYVTLEPCSTFGRTPPCTNLIIASGIKEVVIATKDPNPIHKNRGIRCLKRANIKVSLGILENEAKEMNRIFEKFVVEKKPYITAKVAQSLDGKIATATGESKWITGLDSRRLVHKLRSQADAILIGVNTIIRDDPLLTNRLYRGSKKQPIKIVLDSHLRTPPNSRIFSKDSPQQVILAATPSAPTKRIRFFEKKGVRVLVIKNKKRKVSLKDLMKRLAKMEIAHILVEGGAEVLGSFFKEGLVDKVLFFISPKVIGGADAPTSVMGDGVDRLSLARRLKDTKITRFEEDFLIEGYL